MNEVERVAYTNQWTALINRLSEELRQFKRVSSALTRAQRASHHSPSEFQVGGITRRRPQVSSAQPLGRLIAPVEKSLYTLKNAILEEFLSALKGLQARYAASERERLAEGRAGSWEVVKAKQFVDAAVERFFVVKKIITSLQASTSADVLSTYEIVLECSFDQS